jgi:hypothetical protein
MLGSPKNQLYECGICQFDTNAINHEVDLADEESRAIAKRHIIMSI